MICKLIIDVKHGEKMYLNPNDVNKKGFQAQKFFSRFSVSYTHLTLPTKA